MPDVDMWTLTCGRAGEDNNAVAGTVYEVKGGVKETQPHGAYMRYPSWRRVVGGCWLPRFKLFCFICFFYTQKMLCPVCIIA